MNIKIKSTLKSIDISHLFALNLDHGISYQKSNWELFEPSKFIYSFFTFNMLYEIDWKETFEREYIWDARNHKYTSDRIILLLKFIYSNSAAKPFKNYYLKYDTELSLIENSKAIKTDSKIDREDKTTFLSNRNSYLENFTTGLANLKSDEFSIEDHYRLIIYCYQIRNNIFHGLKKASEMIKSGQRKRLLDYSHIILATTEMFFDVVKSKYNYNSATEDELKENAGLISYN